VPVIVAINKIDKHEANLVSDMQIKNNKIYYLILNIKARAHNMATGRLK
jgi:translation initiation factor IF-2